MLDVSGWAWVQHYRIRDGSDVTSRNKATLGQVIRAVILQQSIQTALGWWWLRDIEPADVTHGRAMGHLYPIVLRALDLALGKQNATRLAALHGPAIVSIVYWWAIPTVQFLFALYVLSLRHR